MVNNMVLKIWIIGKIEKRKLEVFKMWCYSKHVKGQRIGKIINEKLLNRIMEKLQL